MAKEFFKAHFFPERVRPARVVHQQPQLLPRRALLQRVSAAAARSRRAADAALHRRGARGRLLGADLSRRASAPTRARSIASGPGIGMIASRLGVPVVPVRLEGLDKVLHHTWKMAKPGPRPRRVRRAAAAHRRRLRSAGQAGRRRGQSALDASSSGHLVIWSDRQHLAD